MEKTYKHLECTERAMIQVGLEQGTTFTIKLPIIARHEQSNTPPNGAIADAI